ncbi:MAG: DUF3365 domain-containing protein [Magnetococcales bacterium]|nr:DUF3365 domain-containing protein [Magnetococcales bacterium]
MKKFTTALTAIFFLLSAPVAASESQMLLNEGRGLVKIFFTSLKGKLVTALKSGGAVKAIKVCSMEAGEVASEVADMSGWEVKRTSLKLRNPGNEPDAWERDVLYKFNARKSAGESPEKIEFSAIVVEDGVRVFRYMKAIPTAEKPCLVCHGEAIKAPVAKALDEIYPSDQARGYKAGDIRGAFSFRKTIN